LSSLGIHNVGEKKGLAILFGDSAAKLPAHQRVHLSVFVNGNSHTIQQAGPIEAGEMLVQVGIATIGRAGHETLRVLGFSVAGWSQ
jgi:hypothetical protein